MRFHRDILQLDRAAETERIVERLRSDVLDVLRRDGVVLGVSGGIDSAVSVALAVRALGAARVHALRLPYRSSSRASHSFVRSLFVLISHLRPAPLQRPRPSRPCRPNFT